MTCQSRASQSQPSPPLRLAGNLFIGATTDLSVSVPGTTPAKKPGRLRRPAENNADGVFVQFLSPERACVAVPNHAYVTNVTPSLRSWEPVCKLCPGSPGYPISLRAVIREVASQECEIRYGLGSSVRSQIATKSSTSGNSGFGLVESVSQSMRDRRQPERSIANLVRERRPY